MQVTLVAIVLIMSIIDRQVDLVKFAQKEHYLHLVVTVQKARSLGRAFLSSYELGFERLLAFNFSELQAEAVAAWDVSKLRVVRSRYDNRE